MQGKCAICLDRLKYPVGKPDKCEHKFCYVCIDGWMKKRSKCPLCYRTPKYLIKITKTEKETKIPVRKRTALHFENEMIAEELSDDEDSSDEANDITVRYARCRECGQSDNEHLLLLCDGFTDKNGSGSKIRCNVAYHCYCLPEKLDQVPDGDWFCPFCIKKSGNTNDMEKQTHSNTSTINNTDGINEAKEPSECEQHAGYSRNLDENNDSEVRTIERPSTNSSKSLLDGFGCSDVENDNGRSFSNLSMYSEAFGSTDGEDSDETTEYETTESSRTHSDSMEESEDSSTDSDSDKSHPKCSRLPSKVPQSSAKKKTSGSTQSVKKPRGQSTSKDGSCQKRKSALKRRNYAAKRRR